MKKKPAKALAPVYVTDKPKETKLISEIKKVQKLYQSRETEIPKWLTKQGLSDYVISQSQILSEYADWPYVEMGMVTALRVPFPRVNIKERIAVYPNRIERQSIYPMPSLRDFRGGDGLPDHNFMLRTESKIRWGGRSDISERVFFNDEQSFRNALRVLLFSNHMGAL